MEKTPRIKNVGTWIFVVLAVCLCVAPAYGQGNTVTVAVGTGISTTSLDFGVAPTQVLHAVVDGPAAPSGYSELWYTLPNSGSQRSELSVAAKGATRAGRIYAENEGPVQVGVAFSNPNPQAVTLSFFFTNSSGVNFGSGNTIIPANGQIAAFLGESPFNAPAAFRGTFTFNASAPVAGFAVRGYVNEMGLFLMPQVPIVEIGNASMTSVPYFANGNGCTIFFDCRSVRTIATDLILVNPTDNTLSGTITFWGQGAPNSPAQSVAVTIDGQTSSAFDYSVPPRSSRRFPTAGRSDPFQQGSIQITAIGGNQVPAAFAILSTEAETTIIRSQTTIIGNAPASAFRLPVRGFRFGGIFAGFTTQTGVVITNPSSTPIGVSLDMSSMNASTTVTVPARGQIKITPQEHLQLSNGYEGVLRISSSSPISVVGLQNFINQFYGPMAVEAFDESIPRPSDLVFPHLAVGNYRSSLLLFKTSESQSSVATIRFFSPTGQPLDPRDTGLQD
jgi:hypothetical protein